MLQLVSFGQLLKARACAMLSLYKKSISTTFLLLIGLLLVGAANAQVDITMPTVEIDGIDADSDGVDIFAIIIKYIGRFALWVIMLIAGFLAGKTILKSWNEQKMNDQGKWGAIVGDSLGSVIMVIFVIALCTWLLTFLS